MPDFLSQAGAEIPSRGRLGIICSLGDPCATTGASVGYGGLRWLTHWPPSPSGGTFPPSDRYSACAPANAISWQSASFSGLAGKTGTGAVANLVIETINETLENRIA